MNHCMKQIHQSGPYQDVFWMGSSRWAWCHQSALLKVQSPHLSLAVQWKKLRSVLGCHGSGPIRPLNVSWCVMVMIHAICLSGQDMPGETPHVLTITKMAWIMSMTHHDTSSGLRGPDPWHPWTLLSSCCGPHNNIRHFWIYHLKFVKWNKPHKLICKLVTDVGMFGSGKAHSTAAYHINPKTSQSIELIKVWQCSA